MKTSNIILSTLLILSSCIFAKPTGNDIVANYKAVETEEVGDCDKCTNSQDLKTSVKDPDKVENNIYTSELPSINIIKSEKFSHEKVYAIGN
jgi:hypothetical protein